MNTKSKIPSINISPVFVAAGFLFLGLPEMDVARGQLATAGSPQIVMTPVDTTKLGILGWPDSNLSSFLFNRTYYVFASNADLGATQGLTTTDLNSLKTNHRVIKVKALRKGGRGSFDHDYAGGGAVYYDAPSGILIQLYHGEFWYGVSYLPFYSSLGIAVSRDLGKTWRKLGQVISGAAPRANRCPNDIGNASLVLKSDGYLYVYYSDLTAPCNNTGIGLARAKLSDIVSAAQADRFPGSSGAVFMKYFNGSFSEPGVIDPSQPALGGGSFTPLFSYGSGGWPTMSSVAYDSAIRQYVMTYIAGWQNTNETGVALRFSPDGINWSDATIFNLGNTAFYPSLLNTDGGDPNVLGSHFYIYYVNPFPGISTQNMMRVMITLNGGSSPPSPPPTHGVQTITVTFDYDFRLTAACTATVAKNCVQEFVVYDISAGASKAKRHKLFTVPLPPNPSGMVHGISATGPPLDFESGKHLIGVTALEPGTDPNNESFPNACSTWITVP
jgi:hypothetical protein